MIKETRLALEMRPCCDTRQDFKYERCGVANMFLASPTTNFFNGKLAILLCAKSIILKKLPERSSLIAITSITLLG
jgi:hypothetical protein